MTKSRRKPKPLRIKSKSRRIKVRRTWTRSPVEQVVQNKREGKPTRRQLYEDGLDDYNEEKNND